MSIFDTLTRRKSDRAVSSDQAEPLPKRPAIGLALGGGAARGFAHIGVLRTLAAHGIVPDVIVGTSIGAVVGGCHAAGHLDPFEEWGRSLTKRGVLGYLDITLNGSGLIGGSRLAARLDKHLGHLRVEELPVRFAAIATEIKTGHEVWLTRGPLVDALRASYALPGIFTPIWIAGRWLVDGALVNPVPVSAARALGARLVIAVNLNADMVGRGATISDHGDPGIDAVLQPEAPRERPSAPEHLLRRKIIGDGGRPGLSTVMVEAFNVMQDRITRSRLAGDPPDVMVSPRLGPVGLFEFHRAEETIALGAEAMEQAIAPVTEAIAALS